MPLAIYKIKIIVMNEIFKQNPNLEKYYGTSDGEAFYNENDAKNHAKNLDDKTVESVFNEKYLEVIDSEDITEEQKELQEFDAAEKMATLKVVEPKNDKVIETPETLVKNTK